MASDDALFSRLQTAIQSGAAGALVDIQKWKPTTLEETQLIQELHALSAITINRREDVDPAVQRFMAIRAKGEQFWKTRLCENARQRLELETLN
jgi:hypothetical protein